MLQGSGKAWVFVAAGSALVAGCASVPATTVDVRPVTATVTNGSGKTVSTVNYQPCDATDSWRTLPIGPLGSGATTTFPMPANCVNLQAFYSDGRLAGTQTGIRRDFPFVWVIR